MEQTPNASDLMPTDAPFTEAQLDGAARDPDYADTALRDVVLDWDDIEWALRRIRQAQAELDDLDAKRAHLLAPIEAWHREESQRRLNVMIFLLDRVKRYGVAMRERDDQHATLYFPSGTIKTTRRKEPRVVVDDEDTLLEWIHGGGLAEDELPAVINTTEKVRVGALRDVLTIHNDAVIDIASGELVPGVAIEPPGVSARVTTTPQEDQP